LALAALAAVQAASAVQSFAWSPDRRLSWSDFVGKPQMGSDAIAVTAYRLTFEDECAGNTFTFRVESVFVPDLSWVKPRLLLGGPESDDSLLHEQTHFDLSEVSARRLRRALKELVAPCAQTSEERLEIAKRLMQDDTDIQRRYDSETANGSNRNQQGNWVQSVARQLASLRQFAQ
jgi:hypothetical protein